MKQTLSITRKELSGYFGSPMALIFLGAFLAATLFSFFWVDTFFARGIADVRPLFRWMPILMIFLIAALTMRQWSEEQRSGTLEVLLTLPVPYPKLVLGKFLAVMALVMVALGMTFFLPLTVSILGNLDWGPVVGGYLATLLLAASYAAIGLFVSSRTDNQIVSLITASFVCGLFYLVGSSGVTDFLSDALAQIFRSIGTGSRFVSIERGVIDLRDLIYYFSLTALFLTLNVASLESKKWSKIAVSVPQRREVTLTTLFIALNLIALNVWLHPLRGLRLDLTAQREYSLSETTRDLLVNLQEPLVIRGYFSERTHPLLAPLVPRIGDMLQEYEIASGGKIELEIIDPAQFPEKEAEANQIYGIQPTPFQVSDRYQSSIINSYFSILIRYGDQSQVLGYGDLIEIQQRRDDSLDVSLRNLEYDLTRSIKKVVYGFQSLDAVFSALKEPVHLSVYLTPESLPEPLREVPSTISKVAAEYEREAEGRFRYEIVNPDDPDAPVGREDLYELYGIRPIAASLFSEQSYYLYLVLQVGEQSRILYPSGSFSEADIRTTIESGLKRTSPGFLKVVGLWQPPAQPQQNAFGQPQQPLSTWRLVSEQLQQDYQVRLVDLSSGEVPADIDVLVLLAPQGLGDKERFAIDQYLMRGGSIVAAAGNYGIDTDPMGGGLTLKPLERGLQDLLSSYGVRVENTLVMDPQNEPFPVPVSRDVGGMQVREIQLMDYPFFVDIRPDGMNSESPIVANLPAVTLNWVSPVIAEEGEGTGREVNTLLQSSPVSWLRTDTNIQPNFGLYPEVGFARQEPAKSYPLAVSVQGVFESYFTDRPSPLLQQDESEAVEGTEVEQTAPAQVGTIKTSPESARLVVIGSAEFLDDVVLQLSSSGMGERYLNSLQFLQNAVDWSVEDLDLLEIRSRGTQVRVLKPMNEGEQRMWEAGNYAAALLSVLGVGMIWNARRQHEEPIELVRGESGGAAEKNAAERGTEEQT